MSSCAYARRNYTNDANYDGPIINGKSIQFSNYCKVSRRSCRMVHVCNRSSSVVAGVDVFVLVLRGAGGVRVAVATLSYALCILREEVTGKDTVAIAVAASLLFL